MDANTRNKSNRRLTQMDADRISERRLRELTAPYLRPFVSIRGWFCFRLFSVSYVSLADVAERGDGRSLLCGEIPFVTFVSLW
jgi:hypothetical protein